MHFVAMECCPFQPFLTTLLEILLGYNKQAAYVKAVIR